MKKPGSHNNCFHCGLPLPANGDWLVEINGQREPMCCPGCKAVAEAIVDNHLESYYQQRTEKADTGRTQQNDALEALSLFDQAEVQKSFVHDKAGYREASLILEGIHCAACIWLNEKHLQDLEGVHHAQINYATHRAIVSWDESIIKLSEILNAIKTIGYRAHPYDPSKQQAILEKEKKDYLKRLGLAGVLGMQVMVFAVAMYLGDWSGMDDGFRKLFTWLSLFLTIPVLTYSARPFFDGAIRDIKRLHAGMDVPVSLGMLLAFSGSAWNTWSGAGHVYYESVCMFAFFLLTARYLEMQARKQSAETSESLRQGIPAMARLIDTKDGKETWVTASTLVVGDQIRVRPGETIAADGFLQDTKTSVDESLITGEHESVLKQIGDEVIGGSINTSTPIVVEVTRTGNDTVLSTIQNMMDKAQTGKPRISHLADRAASWFVLAVLVLASAVALFWGLKGSEQWLAITVSVLVVTCPCALSLATPTAIAAATGVLTRLGMVPSSTFALDGLANVNEIVFDKTGTLTEGKPTLVHTRCYNQCEPDTALQLAQALERHLEHPIAKCFQDGSNPADNLIVSNIEHTVGAGLCGTINNIGYCIGNAEFIRKQFPTASVFAEDNPEKITGTLVYLAKETELMARFELKDELRPNANKAVSELLKRKFSLSILSGDRQNSVKHIANELGISNYLSGLSPADKLKEIQQLQTKGSSVAMVGDGINDAPVLAAANISIAMGAGTQLVASKADYILINNHLPTLVHGIDLSRKTMAIIRQNLTWAVLYNVAALPLAAFGLVPPWLAALGMSASSLIVVLNALRLTRYKVTKAK